MKTYDPAHPFRFWAVVCASVLALLIIYNRWIVTDLGLASFGRVWHLFVSYGDFGFVRRGFVGTILSTLNLRAAFSNDYNYAYSVYLIQLIILYALVIRVFLKTGAANNAVFTVVFFLSPAFFLQAGYLSGTQDITVLILTITAIFYAKNLAAVTAICVVGILVHELFLFCTPTVLCLHWLRRTALPFPRGSWKGAGQPNGSLVFKIFAAVAAIALTLFIIMQYGRLSVEREAFEAAMATKMPDAAYVHTLWSGYFEVSSSAEENVALKDLKRWITGKPVYYALPLLYSIILSFLAAWSFQQINRRVGLLIFFCTLFPISTALIATDLYRWLGMSANLGLLSLLYALSYGYTVSTRAMAALLPFSVLAPFGSYPWERPFPLHQFILEKLM
jgi:hypothetical protein